MSQTAKDNLIVLGIVVVIVGAATGLVYVPQRSRLSDLRARTAREQLRLTENIGKSAAVPAMVREVQSMRKRYSNFDRRLPKRKELGEFLREISGNISQEDLSNQLIEPGTPARAKLFRTFPIVLRFQG
ncbi:MAG: type 4a pilus biogenesis protein PilO, partial [Planctomycetota bacterium]